jgi:hypothetical protein
MALRLMLKKLENDRSKSSNEIDCAISEGENALVGLCEHFIVHWVSAGEAIAL